MSLSVSVVRPACSPLATAPAVKKYVLYSVEEPLPVVETSSETITLSPQYVGTVSFQPAYAGAIVPPLGVAEPPFPSEART